MGGALRFASSCGCHHSGIFLGCLTAILLVAGTGTQSRAEENTVSITIDEPRRLKEGSKKKEDFEDLKELIQYSFEAALSPEFEIFDDGLGEMEPAGCLISLLRKDGIAQSSRPCARYFRIQ